MSETNTCQHELSQITISYQVDVCVVSIIQQALYQIEITPRPPYMSRQASIYCADCEGKWQIDMDHAEPWQQKLIYAAKEYESFTKLIGKLSEACTKKP